MRSSGGMNEDEAERLGKTPSPAESMTMFRKSRALVSSGPITWRPFKGSPVKGTDIGARTCESSLAKVAGRMGSSSSESLFRAT